MIHAASVDSMASAAAAYEDAVIDNSKTHGTGNGEGVSVRGRRVIVLHLAVDVKCYGAAFYTLVLMQSELMVIVWPCEGPLLYQWETPRLQELPIQRSTLCRALQSW